MIFAGIERAARRLSEIRTEQRLVAIAEALREDPANGIRVERMDGGIRLSGRGLKRRLALDPEARASIGRTR